MDSDLSQLVPSRNQRWILRIRCWSPSLLQRVLILASFFVAELTVLSFWLDGASLSRRTGLIGVVGDWGAWLLRSVLGFAAIFVTFAWLKNKAAIEAISSQVERAPIQWGFLAAHCFAMAAFVELSSLIYVPGRSGRADILATSWLAAGISAIILAGFAFLPPAMWIRLVRGTGYLWAYALIAAVSACVVGNMARSLWQPIALASHLTFGLTKGLLSFFVSGIVSNPEKMVLGTQRFSVEIAPQCCGLEGVGLIMAFGVLWLLLFRRECRFPRSLVLIPFGVALIFLLNAARIAALILIGNAGAQQIALGGFHSQAGWIAFSAVGVGFCFAIQRVPWFTARQQHWESLDTATHNPTAAFLSPFLTILAVGMIAGAATAAGSVEWLYPLRFLAALGILWLFRRSYASLNWKCDWLAPAIGAIVFVMWIGLDRFSNPTADREVSTALMASSAVLRVTWITFRVLAAVVTVPLAEELAFRVFLMRRLISQDFESVSLQTFSWFALLVSSVVFGLLHGGYWIAASIAGILFGLAVIRRGRIGDAVVAHATANALLAAYILAYHEWHLW